MHDLRDYSRPWLFFGLSIAIPWALWLPVAWMSHHPGILPRETEIGSLLAVAGICAPMLTAFALILPNRNLRADCWRRLFNFGSAKPIYWLIALLLMPASILLAIAISLLFGYDIAQFQIASKPSFTAGALSPWAILIWVAIIEELGWHNYGTDALRNKFTLFATSMMFSVYWGSWHLPLALIKGYYQANLVHTGIWVSLNFFVSVFPLAFLINWLYYRAGRNIWIAALFHVTAGFFNELFSPHPDTKLFQTAILLLVTAAVVLTNRRLFFAREIAT